MKPTLSLISRIHEGGNRIILEMLNENSMSGLVPSHGDILVILYKYGKMSMKDIAKRINRTKATVTVLVNKLEKHGYVKREKSSEDSRLTYICLTSKGEDFKEIFLNISTELNNRLYQNFSEEETEILDKPLQKMVQNI